MSVVMMQRKLKAKQNMSRGTDGFSIKGTRRNLGRIGSDSKNSTIRTIFRGTAPVGHGANPITGYPVEILCNNGLNCSGSTCEQTSTLTNKGYIESHLINNIDCGDKCIANWVKSFNPLEHSQGSYIRRIKVHRKGCETERSEENYSNETSCIDDCVNTYFIGTRKISRDTYHKSTHGAITSGEYTEIDLLKNNCLPDAACKKPFPFVLTRDGCRKEYYTPEEAIADGLLPRDWMNCKTKYPTNHHWRSILNPYL